MVWQEEIETGRVSQIAKAAEDTAAPAAPNTGTAQTFSGDWSANDFELTDDDIDIVDAEDDSIIVKPPLTEAKRAKIRDSEAIDHVIVTCYEVGGKLFAWATNMTESPTGTWVTSATFTRVAFIVEVEGLAMWWFPSVEIKVLPPATGAKKVASQQLYIDVFGSDTYATGYKVYYYQDAS